MTAPIPSGGWAVTSQQQTTDLDPSSGAYVSGWRITFRTAAGHIGSVFVTEAGYYPAMVKQIIDSKAQLVDQVGTLTSDG